MVVTVATLNERSFVEVEAVTDCESHRAARFRILPSDTEKNRDTKQCFTPYTPNHSFKPSIQLYSTVPWWIHPPSFPPYGSRYVEEMPRPPISLLKSHLSHPSFPSIGALVRPNDHGRPEHRECGPDVAGFGQTPHSFSSSPLQSRLGVWLGESEHCRGLGRGCWRWYWQQRAQ